jgi:hypothetical protein
VGVPTGSGAGFAGGATLPTGREPGADVHEVPPDREHRTSRAAALVSMLGDRLGSSADNGEVVFGFKLVEVRAALDNTSSQQRVSLEKFCRWLAAHGAGPRVIQGCAAFVLMRGVENPFAYFAPGQPARISVEAWAGGR